MTAIQGNLTCGLLLSPCQGNIKHSPLDTAQHISAEARWLRMVIHPQSAKNECQYSLRFKSRSLGSGFTPASACKPTPACQSGLALEAKQHQQTDTATHHLESARSINEGPQQTNTPPTQELHPHSILAEKRNNTVTHTPWHNSRGSYNIKHQPIIQTPDASNAGNLDRHTCSFPGNH